MTVKQGDTRNAIQSTLRKYGEAIDLTDCRVKLKMKNFEAYMKMYDAGNGAVYYPLSELIIKHPGKYPFEIEVEYKDGRTETFPNEGYLYLNIEETIGGNG